MITGDNTAPAGFARLGQVGTVLGAIGLIGLGIGLAVAHGDPDRIKNIMQAYLFGWVLAMLLCLGCYGFMLLHYMTRGSWGRPVIRMFEAGAKTMPLMFLLYVPLLIWAKYLYPWANLDLVNGNAALGIHADVTLQHRAGYENVTMVAFRTLVYFLIWYVTAIVLIRMSIRHDATGNERDAVRRQKMASYAFLVYVFSATMAFTDWIMSLDTHWFSTIYGLWFVDFQGLAALSFVSLIVCRYKMAHREPYATLVTPQVTRDIGNLLLTLVMVWAYFSVSQWIIIWSGNLPEEVAFYLQRNSGTFLLVGAADILFSFFLPFVMLLSGKTKRYPQMLATVSVLLLVMRVVDIFWVVIPVTRHPIAPIPADVAGALFLVGAFLAGFAYFIKQAAIIPRNDAPNVLEVAAHG
jgi:hypothetical protein